MRIGLGLPNVVPGVSSALMLDWARKADAGPFTSLGVLDRIVYDSYEPMTALAAAAAVTRRVRLVTMCVISPWRNATILAKEAATINALSGGRLVLGLALGARTDDYEAAELEQRGRGQLMDRQLAALRAQWLNEAIGPRTRPPELLVGGLSDQAFRRMALHADGYVHNGGPPKVFAKAAGKARAAWTETGRPERLRLWGQTYFALGNVTAGAAYMKHYYAFTGPFAEKLAAGLLTTPEAIVDFIKGYEAEGCDELVFLPTVPNLDEIDRLAEIVSKLQ
jgi:alkanesulfonate monooxygenase SsuD/methylene tetrahydromethanopterin reductase-like flavin-dependent oxidoreductase (luciferase family)